LRRDETMAKKKIQFKESKPFYDIIKRRKQCREYFIQWLKDNADVIDCEENCDVTKLSFICFKYKPHGRHRNNDITKGEIYKRLAELYKGLGMAQGFEYGGESFFRYISSCEHSNLATTQKALKREIMRCLACCCNKEKLVGINCNCK